MEPDSNLNYTSSGLREKVVRVGDVSSEREGCTRTNEPTFPPCTRVKLQCQQRASSEPRVPDECERQECEGFYSTIPTTPLWPAVK